MAFTEGALNDGLDGALTGATHAQLHTGAPGAAGTANVAAGVVRVRHPSGQIDEYTTPDAAITNPGVGVWVFTFPDPFTTSGVWYVKFNGTAGLITAGEIALNVASTLFPPVEEEEEEAA